MGDANSGTTYGDEPAPGPNGPGGNAVRTGPRARIGSRFATITGRETGAEGAEQERSGARISTGEQVLGAAQARRQRAEDTPKVSVAEAQSAAKSSMSPLRVASRMLSSVVKFDASMTEEEQRDISEPLARIYQRNPHIASYVNRYTDPTMVLISLLVYGARIWLTWQETQLVRAQAALLERQTGARIRQAPVTPITRPQPVPESAPPVAPVAPDLSRPVGPTAVELTDMMKLGG